MIEPNRSCASFNPHKLLIFGDSWSYGAELGQDRRSIDAFPYQLGRLLNLPVKNYSESGSGLTHLQIQLTTAIDEMVQTSQSVGVFFLTSKERFLFFDSDGAFAHCTPTGEVVRPCQQHRRQQFENINDFYWKNIHSIQSDQINLNLNLISLQSRCKYHGIKDFYISGWQNLDLWPEVDTARIYCQGMKTCADLLCLVTEKGLTFEDNPYIVNDGTHPNAEGHKIIAQEIYEMITSCLTTT